MKKSLVFVLVAVLLVMGSVAASAEELKISVDGGYTFSSVESGTDTFDANGFLFGANFNTGAFGGEFKLAKLGLSNPKSDGFSLPAGIKFDGDLTKMDFLGSYALNGLEGFDLKVFGGYTTVTQEYTLDATALGGSTGTNTITLSGIVLGAKVNKDVTDQFSISGSFGFLPVVNATDSLTGYVDAEGKGTGLEFEIAGKYAVMPNLSVEAGYSSSSTTIKYDGATEDSKGSVGGFFGKVQYSF